MKIFAIANEKGGVGKSTIAYNVGAGLARKGKRVLIVELDTQANLSKYALPNYEGVKANEREIGAVLLTGASVDEVIRPVLSIKNFFLIPAGRGLVKLDRSDTEIDLSSLKYDFIFIDCPPAMRGCTIAGIRSADLTIIPTTCDQFSFEGVQNAAASVADRKKKVAGIIINKYIPRFLLNKQIREDLENFAEEIGTKVYNSTIRDSVIIRESQLMAQDIFSYNKKSGVAEDFAALVKDIIKEWA